MFFLRSLVWLVCFGIFFFGASVMAGDPEPEPSLVDLVPVGITYTDPHDSDDSDVFQIASVKVRNMGIRSWRPRYPNHRKIWVKLGSISAWYGYLFSLGPDASAPINPGQFGMVRVISPRNYLKRCGYVTVHIDTKRQHQSGTIVFQNDKKRLRAVNEETYIQCPGNIVPIQPFPHK